MTAPSVGSPTVGLGRFVKESRFRVPSHQRDYSWIEDYVREFIDDIEISYSSGRESYFCGLMVFTSLSPSYFKVLDGQQRLATTLMLYSAVRNWLAGFTAYDEWRHQVDEYLGSRELGSTTREARLALTAANNDIFQKYVIQSVPLAEMEKAVRSKQIDDRSMTLIKAAIFINKYVIRRASEFDSSDAAKDHFLSFLKYLADNVQVVQFVLGGDDEAYTIFETLNDRGLELSPLDLVKNYLFAHAEKFRKGSLAEFENRWTEMMALLSSARADSFLRAFWSCRHGKPEGKKLFTAFKVAYKEPNKLHSVSVEMRRDAERYAALFSPQDAVWSPYTAATKRNVEALGIIGFSQAYPIILSAIEKFEKREVDRLLWLIVCIAVRHQLIGRRRPGRVESLGGRAAKEIFDGKITTATGVLTAVRELYVPDDEFRIAFESYEENSGKKIRYLLAELERESISRDSSTLDDELTPDSVTVEHIFPKSPSVDWKHVVKKDKDWENHFIARLGNLCLLPGINHALGNKSFDDKKSVYSKSRLKLTNGLAGYKTWGRTEIGNRQQHLAKLAVAAWRFQ